MSLVLLTQTRLSRGLIVRLWADHFPTTNELTQWTFYLHMSLAHQTNHNYYHIRISDSWHFVNSDEKPPATANSKPNLKNTATCYEMFYLLKTRRCSAFLWRLGVRSWPRSWRWSWPWTRTRPRRSFTACWRRWPRPRPWPAAETFHSVNNWQTPYNTPHTSYTLIVAPMGVKWLHGSRCHLAGR